MFFSGGPNFGKAFYTRGWLILIYWITLTDRSAGNDGNGPTVVSDHKIIENTKPGHIVGRYQALVGRLPCPECWLEIDPASDPDKHFCIEKKNGSVKLVKPLDKEKARSHHITIWARNNNGFKGQSTSFMVNVTNHNDNLPELNALHPITIDQREPEFSLSFRVFDRDNITVAHLVAQISGTAMQEKFNLTCFGVGNNVLNCTIRPKTALDREPDGSLIYVPINVSDHNKHTHRSVIRYIPIRVSERQGIQDSQSAIQVFVYNNTQNKTSTLDIGMVHVQGLDSSNVYQCQMEKSVSEFSVSTDGRLTTNLDTVELQNYALNVTVTSDKNEQVSAVVNISIEHITKRQIDNAGSIRIQNIEPAAFLTKYDHNQSQYDILRLFLSDKFNVSLSNVLVFSIMSENRHPPVVQIYYTVSGQFWKSTFLNGIVAISKNELERVLGNGAKVLQVNVDDCVFEGCGGGCSKVVTARGEPTVWNAEEQSLAGITIATTTDDHCYEDPIPQSCSPNPCFNRGLCHMADTGAFCDCPGNSSGPFCQGRMRTFYGDSYLWLDPIKPCEQLRIQFYFMTEQETALLFYNGPLTNVDAENVYSNPDFIAVYLLNKKVILLLNLGDANQTVVSNFDISLGEWHKLEVHIVEKNITLTLDDKYTSDKVTTTVNGTYRQLNVNDPLQIGGLAKTTHTSYPDLINNVHGFDGCISDFYINNMMQDLTTVSYSVNSEPGCSKTNDQCLLGGNPFCVNGLCVASVKDKLPKCVCDIEYVGVRCDKKTTWYHFQENSYMQYQFESSLLPANPTSDVNIRMLFMPDQKDGVLFRGAGHAGHIQLQLSDWHADYHQSTNANGHEPNKSLTLQQTALNASERYLIQLKRSSNFLKLSLDYGLKNLSAEVYGHNRLVQFESNRFFVGSESEYGHNDFQGCIAQIFYNDHPLPLEFDEKSSLAIIVNRTNVTNGCSHMKTCANTNLVCPYYYACKDFWKMPICTCAPNTYPIFDECDVWIGCRPTSAFASPTLGITREALAVILICLLLLLLLILFLIIYSCRRRRARAFYSIPSSVLNDLPEGVGADDASGAGEANRSKYDKNMLRVPIIPPDHSSRKPSPSVPGSSLDLGPYDEHRIFGRETPPSTVGSLSPLPSDDEDTDLTWSKSWGPKFAPLANIR